MRDVGLNPKRWRGTPGRPGFTLIELMIVLIIIGILVAFILSAAFDGIRRAEERATQALIAKIDAGLNDRLQGLLAQSVEPNATHQYFAATWNAAVPVVAEPSSPLFGLQAIPSKTRAFTLAKIDYIKAEMPDVFVVQPVGSDPLNSYPLNFGGAAYPGTPAFAGSFAAHAPYALPLGSGILRNPAASSYGDALPTATAPVTTGIYGASYPVAAGLYKQLFEAVLKLNPGITPPSPPTAGFDGVDNDGDGLVDEIGENGKPAADAMIALLANHRHKTARAAMLYALLVEGQGPLGAVFSPDDFRESEVKDTDGDGLLEFVDAWGEPLQFYRWPIFYQSDSQRGYARYSGVIETRDQNPLDPNQQLLSPSWWGANFNADSPYPNLAPFGAPPMSRSAGLFQAMFFSLTDPNAHPSLNPAQGFLWDRGPVGGGNATYPRRAFYSRFLVLSAGPDRTPGVPVFDNDSWALLSDFGAPTPSSLAFNPPVTTDLTSIRALRIESQAGAVSPDRSTDFFMTVISTDNFSGPLREAAGDDITNHNLQAAGGATQ